MILKHRRCHSEKTDIRFDLGKYFMKEYNLPFEPRDYQIDAVESTLKYGRQLLLSPTASGKSLIIYLLLRWYLNANDKKTIVIVPTTSLVEQMAKDFQDYGYDKDICKIYEWPTCV